MKKWYENLKLKNKLLFLLSCSLVILMLLSVTLFTGVWHYMVRRETERASEQVLYTLESNLENTLEMLSSYSKLIIGDDVIQNFLSEGYDYNQVGAVLEAETHLGNYLGIDPMISSIYVFSYNGTVLSRDMDRTKTPKSVLKSMPWYQEVYSRKGDWYMELNADSTFEMKEDSPCISFIRLIRSVDDYCPLGALVINVTQDYLMDMLTGEDNLKYDIMLFSGDDEYVFGTRDLNTDKRLIECVSSSMKGDTAFFFDFEKEEFYAQKYVSEDNGWIMVIMCDTSEAGQGIYRYIFSAVIVIMLLIGGTILVEARIMNKMLTIPVLKLASQMKKAEKGDFNKICGPDSKDELGILYRGYNKMVGRIEELFVNLKREQKEKYKAELSVLQAQIKPHFLYNSLETANALLKMGENEQAKHMLHVLSEYYKRSLSDGREEITLSEDIQIVKDYIAVQMIRMQEKCSVEYDIDETLTEVLLPKLTLQPLVENCFMHGVVPSKYRCTIRISVFGDDDNIYIDISDDGVGMEKEKLHVLLEAVNGKIDLFRWKSGEKRKGIGIRNTILRLRGYFDETDIFRIESEPGAGTRFQIRIPVRMR